MSNGDAPPALVVDAAVAGQELADPHMPTKFRMGVVTAYSEAPPARIMVREDNTRTETPARSVLNQPLSPGNRVQLAWFPEGGCTIIGCTGRVPYPSALVQRTTAQSIPDNAEATIGSSGWSTTRYLYGGVTIHSSGGLTIPFTGLWAASANVTWDLAGAGLTTSQFFWLNIQRMASDGTTQKDVMARFDGVGNGWLNSNNLASVAWPCNAGEVIRLRVKQYTLTTGTAKNVTAADLSIQWQGMCDDVMT